MNQRYLCLDGLRGIAALAVAALHATQIFRGGWSPPHAALAVDFFFCLSGFVIANAYDRKLATGRLDLKTFARKRIERLYPMILAGVALGCAVMMVSATHSAPQPLWRVVFLAVSAALLLPAGLLFGMRAFQVNDPLWSLMFEVIANAVYAPLAQRKLPRWVGPTALGLSAAALLAASIAANGVGSLGFEMPGFLGGFARVAFPFIAGVAISRLGLAQGREILPGYVVGGGLALLLLGPALGPMWLYDAAVILLVFPAVVICGARVTPSPVMNRIWRVLGDVSYPLYAVHLPLILAVQKVQNHALRLPTQGAVIVLSLAVALVVSWVALKLYDEPARKWLGERRFRFPPAPEAIRAR